MNVIYYVAIAFLSFGYLIPIGPDHPVSAILICILAAIFLIKTPSFRNRYAESYAAVEDAHENFKRLLMDSDLASKERAKQVFLLAFRRHSAVWPDDHSGRMRIFREDFAHFSAVPIDPLHQHLAAAA